MKYLNYFIALNLAILIFGSIGAYSYFRLQDIKEDIKICKSLGFDGVRFVNAISTKVECSKYTELERAKEKKR